MLGRLVGQMGSVEAGEGYPTSPQSATTPAGASMGGGETEGSGASDATEGQLGDMNVDELRGMARDKGVTGVHDMRKEELIEALREQDDSWACREPSTARDEIRPPHRS